MSRETKCFGDRIGELISESDKSWRQIAKEVGVSTGSISKYQNDNMAASIDVLAGFASHFNVSADWLLGFSEFRSRENAEEAVSGLGLSEKAVIALKGLKDSPLSLSILNRLFTTEAFIELLSLLGSLEEASAAAGSSECVEADRNNTLFYRFLLSSKFNEVIDSLFTAYCISSSSHIPVKCGGS